MQPNHTLPNSSQQDHQQMIHQLHHQCSDYLSEEEVTNFLSSSQWNYSQCEYLLVNIPKEIENKTLIDAKLALRVLSQSNWNLELCQNLVNMILQFCEKTQLNYYLCFDCLSQAQWNEQLALEMFEIHRHNIPENGFVNNVQYNTQQQSSNQFSDSDSDSGSSPSNGAVYFNNCSTNLSSSLNEVSNSLHVNTPESSPKESSSILNTGRISIISNYF